MTASLETVRRKIEAAALAAGRGASEVKLIAVSKTFGPQEILPILEAGQRRFGENRVQEAMKKWPALKERFPDAELHLIGPLQSNKAREAVELFDVIHSVDRLSLAPELGKAIARKRPQAPPRFLCQVNIGDEPQKAGAAMDETASLIGACRAAHGIAIEGLMCIPPDGQDAAPHFKMLAGLAERLGLPELSMGMSGDYETAIAHGATYIRVGSAIFGVRA